MDHFKDSIQLGKAPRKEVVEEYLKENNETIEEIKGKTWKDVKTIVWNEIKKKSRKRTTLGDIKHQIITHPAEKIKAGRFLLILTNTTAGSWQLVQTVVAGEAKKGKKKSRNEK